MATAKTDNIQSMQVPATAFKAYDIRGVVPDALNPEFARALGLAFGARALSLGEQQVAVGRDGRLSSPALAAALIEGLVEAGIQVIDVGMVTTPMTYYAANVLCNSGIQVTGSHNPKHHNGFKIVASLGAFDCARYTYGKKWFAKVYSTIFLSFRYKTSLIQTSCSQ